MRDTTSIGKILESMGVIPSPEEKKKLTAECVELCKAIRFHMYKKSPAFAIILGQMKMIFTYNIPTMAVDAKNNIYINPQFSKSMTPEENLAVLIHEVMHIATLTFHRQRGRDMKLWNICTDYCMNYEIKKAGFSLPKMGLIPEDNGDIFFKDYTGKVHTLNIANKNAEWLYQEYLKLPTDPNKPKGGEGEGEGEGDGEGESGEGQPGQGKGKGKPGKGKLGKGDPYPVNKDGTGSSSFDDHLEEGDEGPGGAEEGSDEANTEPLTKGELKNMLNKAKNGSDALRQNDRSQGRSEGGISDIAEVMFKQLQSKTDYKMILKDLFKKTKQIYDWRKPSRRSLAVGSFLPKSTKMNEGGDVGIAIDTSGSISDEDINVIMNEVAKLVKQFPNISVEVVLWNSIAYYHTKFAKTNIRTIVQDVCKNVRSGGTELSSVAKFYEHNKMKAPQAMVYFTDGYTESNPMVLDKCRNIFMIFSWGSDAALKQSKKGTVYNINL